MKSGVILHTSGSTGTPKEVVYTPKMIQASAENLILSQGFHPGLTFVTTGPLDHLGSLSKVWATELAGGTVRSLPGMKDLSAFFQAFPTPPSKGGRGGSATFLVPSAIRMLLRFAPRELAALNNKLEFLETGAAPLLQDDMDELCRLLPDVRLYNTYASTETGIQCTHDFNHDGRWAGCLGRPMKNAHVEILSPSKGETEGVIRCTGPCVMGGDFTTNDLGHFDSEGRLWLTGRADNILNIGGYKINPEQVEAVAMQFPGIQECRCRAIPHPVLGQALQLQYIGEGGRKLAQFLQSKLPKESVPTSLQQVESLPHASNGKLQRNV